MTVNGFITLATGASVSDVFKITKIGKISYRAYLTSFQDI
jgi:hypothetical protein